MERLASIKRVIAGLGYAKIGAMAIAAVSVLMLVGWIATRSTAATGLLYSGLDPAEAGRIAQRLDELKVPYDAKGDGTVIMVPRSEVARTRMMLAASGLPHQGGVGYELLDSQSPMNMTSFMQRVQRLRALEGELARTIVTLNGVRSARVHVVLPERDTFSRDTPKPTASVAVTMTGAMRLTPAQAAAIRVLIAGAVSGLQQDDISVVDPSGIVLAADGSEALIGSHIAELKASDEQAMQRAVQGLLEPLVGQGKVRVVASVNLDSSHEVSRDEKYDPLSQVERSKQIQLDRESSEDSKPRAPVSVGQNLPNQQTSQTDPGSKSVSNTSHDGQTINYEIGSTKTERVREPGDIKRLTIAVVVDGTVDGKGVYQPRSKQELDRIADLVRSAVGYDAKRGDQVTVDTMRFIPSEQSGIGSDEGAAAAQIPVMWIAIGGVAGLLLIGAGLVMMGRRKRERLRLANAEGEALLPGPAQATAAAAALAESLGLPAPLAPLATLFQLVDTRPDESLAVIRAWIAEGDA
ncbi:MAG TPA: flagellar basal-body MS-ring/collar protein FliF [Rhodopila sp.]|nr:flagellar basal-body MS-ring/collar protein FliF [Rhodopila sp.]